MPSVFALSRRVKSKRDFEYHHHHTAPVPRLGGVALVTALLGVELFLQLCLSDCRSPVDGRPVVLLSSLAMFALGFWDDIARLGAKRKLTVQILIAWVVYFSGIGIQTFQIPFTEKIVELHAWGGLPTVLWLVCIPNLINTVDGIDGLAAGLGLMLMGLLVYVGMQNGTYTLLAAGMTGALAGFLCFNFPPARIYLGDGGAYFIGFQIAIFSLVGSHKGTVVAALVAPLFALAFPIVDTSIAILRRGLLGLPLFRPDRNHLHHRLLRSGMTHRQVVLCVYKFCLPFLCMAFLVSCSRGQLVPVLLGVAVLLLLVSAGKLSFSREWFSVRRTLGNSLAMRKEIQYALSLTTWLRHEARRGGSLEQIHGDVVFAARKLGFTMVSLRFKETERKWHEPISCKYIRHFRHELRPYNLAVLELAAPTCGRRSRCAKATAVIGATSPEGKASSPGHSNSDLQRACCGGNPKMLEVLAELVAEACQPAPAVWETQSGQQ